MKQETRDQLREILCEVPEVEKDVKEVKKGCIVNDTDFGTGRAEIFGEYNANTFIVIRELEKERPHLERKTDIEDWEIIGNPLQEKYFYMYSEEKGIDILDTFKVIYDNFDYKKTIDTQDDKFYEILYKHLTSYK